MDTAKVIFTVQPTSSMDTVSIWLYIIEGSIIFVVNSILFIRIMCIPDVRNQKEFVLMAACVLFDIFFGATYLSAGSWRAFIYFTFDYIPASTRWQCFVSPSVQLFTIITPAAGYIIVLTALDRLYCVFFPIKYIKTSVSYGYLILVLPFILTLPTYLFSLFESHLQDSKYEHTMICLMSQGVSVRMYTIMRSIRIICCLLVVALYVPVGVRMYKIVRRNEVQTGMSVQNQKKLVKLTLTIALITINTLVLFTIPDIILFFNPTTSTFGFFLMNLNKGIVNLIALFATQKPMRRLVYKSGSKVAVSTIVVKQSGGHGPRTLTKVTNITHHE